MSCEIPIQITNYSSQIYVNNIGKSVDRNTVEVNEYV